MIEPLIILFTWYFRRATECLITLVGLRDSEEQMK